MADVIANGVRLHVQRLTPRGGPRPGAPVVVMIHGMVMDNLASVFFLANGLADAGCDVICYDLRGHGRSERTPSGYGMANAMADLTGLLDGLGVTGPVHLVGNSFGATLALAYGCAYPERVASLGLIEGPFLLSGLGEEMSRSIQATREAVSDDEVREWLEHSAARGVARMAKAALSLMEQTTIAEDIRATPSFRAERLAALGRPVLAVYGGNSEIVDQGRELARLVPDTTLVVLEHHTHSVLREAAEYLRDLLRWWMVLRDTEPEVPVYHRLPGRHFETADWVRERRPPDDILAQNAARRARLAAEARAAEAGGSPPVAEPAGAVSGASGPL
ncbi:MAG: alpha/beta hydrolase [Frankia sp.]|nr:alpha/beta hydrolase [Frankia sp.]